jgi:hypothetical protein
MRAQFLVVVSETSGQTEYLFQYLHLQALRRDVQRGVPLKDFAEVELGKRI